MLSPTITKLLTAQVATELHAMLAYRQMASTLRALGMMASADWFRRASSEEHEHGLGIVAYLEHRGAPIDLLAVEPPQRAPDVKSVAATVIALEQSVTAKLSAIRKAAVDEGDALTFEFVSPMLSEQIHSEDDAHVFASFVASGADLMTIDQQVGQTIGSK